GMYMNFGMVAFSGYGEEIALSAGPDATAVGFGQTALPQGASNAPVAGMTDSTPPVPGNDAPPPPVPPAPNESYMAPSAPVWPPEGWKAHPQSAGYFYKGQEVLTEAQLRAKVG